MPSKEFDFNDIKGNLKNEVGERLRMIIRPRLDIIGGGWFQFEEESILNVIKAWSATSMEWEVEDVTFPIVDGIKSVVIIWKRVIVLERASNALYILIAGAGLFLSASLVVWRVEVLTEKAPVSVGLGAVSLIALSVAAIFIIQKVVPK